LKNEAHVVARNRRTVEEDPTVFLILNREQNEAGHLSERVAGIVLKGVVHATPPSCFETWSLTPGPDSQAGRRRTISQVENRTHYYHISDKSLLTTDTRREQQA